MRAPEGPARSSWNLQVLRGPYRDIGAKPGASMSRRITCRKRLFALLVHEPVQGFSLL